MAEDILSGRRVLVVEDEYYLADELTRAARDAGVIVLGPVPRVEAAFDILENGEAPDAAILDMNLGGVSAETIADALLKRGVPFLITTGYDHASLPQRFGAVRRLEKPVAPSAVLRALRHVVTPT
ncbi:response regulator [Methylobacterium gnaphalii]|uniref:Response regulator n=1 Tax=Methylobacterium gnaphalii TaxID=1010610 RepID=A0A512JNJ7_9HYPH|nr:response regulator [Methylobacterium gnaphalii]GEP11433.1 response regulator [Methylobacterium gnaphalii]GJD71286.1 hypothetical protein MMMDOFMJ_4241 [Methylobacterium gnaphalii]GLS48027.1 response regulator [Methylobacterium gnaphalii]